MQLIDPRAQIIFYSVLIVNVLLLSSVSAEALVFFSLLLLFLVGISGQGYRVFLLRMARFYPMILLLSLPLPFSAASGGHPLYSIKFVRIYDTGLERFALLNFKAAMVLGCTLLVTTTNEYSRLITALEWLGLPAWILSVLSYLTRLLHIMEQEFHRMKLAIVSRGALRTRAGKFKTAVNLVLVYSVRTLERSDRVYQAMISRGFRGKFPSAAPLSWSLKDTGIILASSAITLINLFWIRQ